MSQDAHGHGITQVSVVGSTDVNITINGQLAVKLLSPAFPLPPPDETCWELDLLKAPHAGIPFVGRKATLEDFQSWCAGSRALSMRVLAGRGGAGKTRFAYELYAWARQQSQWAAYFLRFLKSEAAEADLWAEIRSENALVIVDYASDVAQPLAGLLRTLAQSPPAGRRIRILLLARAASWEQGWLSGLTSGRTGEDVDRHFHPREPVQLTQFTPEEMREIFRQTLTQASKLAGKPAPPLPPLSEFTRKEVMERLADPLTLMMAALVAIESSVPHVLLLNRTSLAYEVAQKLVADRMKVSVKAQQPLFLHMAAYATLCGGLDKDEALQALESESAQSHLGRVQDPMAFLNTLQAWLPGERNGAWLGPIEPDIVGEAFVLGDGQHVYLWDAQGAVLRSVVRHSGQTLRTLVRTAQDFCFLAAENERRLEPLHWLTAVMEKGEADSDLNLLWDFSSALPWAGSSVVLRKIGLRIAINISARLRLVLEPAGKMAAEDMRSLFAGSLNTLAARQSDAGQREQALKTAEEAAGLYGELAGGNRDAFLPDLAASLNNLANRQSDAGQREEALKTAEEAVRLRRELAGGNRDAFLPALAASLNNLANRQSDAGQREEALKTAEEAAGLYGELAGGNRDAFADGLARACGTMGMVLKSLERSADAAQAFAEGMRAILPVAQRYPAAFLQLMLALVRGYLASCETAQIEPDNSLTTEVMTALGPYLKEEKEEGE